MKHVCISLIRFYRKHLSGLKRHPTCRFTPTCSAYALEAFTKRGFWAGLVLTVWRVLRCNPFCRGGYAPVPEHGFRRVGPGGYSIAEDGNGDGPYDTETLLTRKDRSAETPRTETTDADF